MIALVTAAAGGIGKDVMSVAVWVGLIALAGLDAETGVMMQGAVKRIRPKMMTVTAILVGLLPSLWGHGTGADVMKRIAAPMIGGVITSGILELLIYPAIYTLWKWRWEVRPALTLQAHWTPIKSRT